MKLQSEARSWKHWELELEAGSWKREAISAKRHMLISLFIGCYNDTLFPETGKAVVAVLERLGHEVEFRAAQTCCGQMHYNTGYAAEALPVLRHFVKTFADAAVICVPSASCVAMMRDHYPKMAAESGDAAPDRRGRVAAAADLRVQRAADRQAWCRRRRRQLSAPGHAPYLLPFAALAASRRSPGAAAEGGPRARADASCRARINAAALAARSRSRTRTSRPRWRRRRSRRIVETGAEVCTATDNSCLMQINGVLARTAPGRRCLHLAEILGVHRSRPARPMIHVGHADDAPDFPEAAKIGARQPAAARQRAPRH